MQPSTAGHLDGGKQWGHAPALAEEAYWKQGLGQYVMSDQRLLLLS